METSNERVRHNYKTRRARVCKKTTTNWHLAPCASFVNFLQRRQLDQAQAKRWFFFRCRHNASGGWVGQKILEREGRKSTKKNIRIVAPFPSQNLFRRLIDVSWLPRCHCRFLWEGEMTKFLKFVTKICKNPITFLGLFLAVEKNS